MRNCLVDLFENFGDQMRSYELLVEHQSILVSEALRFRRTHPEMEVVGLAVDAEAREAVVIQKAIERVSGKNVRGRGGFLGVVPRLVVVHLLRATTPRFLEWLPASTSGRTRVLTLVAITRRGVRFGSARSPCRWATCSVTLEVQVT